MAVANGFVTDPAALLANGRPVANARFNVTAVTRKQDHVIGPNADGGWTNEYQDFDQNGRPIGRSADTFDKNGKLREQTTNHQNADGGRTKTTTTFDENGKWTGTKTEIFDKNGKQLGGVVQQPDGKGGMTGSTFDPASGKWVSFPQPVGRKGDHVIGPNADGGKTYEYQDLDKDGKPIGRSSESYDKNGVMREQSSNHVNADGSRVRTTKTFDKDGKWTGTTQEVFKDGKIISGVKSSPDGKGSTTTQVYDSTTGKYK